MKQQIRYENRLLATPTKKCSWQAPNRVEYTLGPLISAVYPPALRNRWEKRRKN
jgi:hypothetical protein